MSNHIDPRRWEQFGWRATVAAVRASKCSLATPASYALCYRLLCNAELRAARHIYSSSFAGTDRQQAMREVDRLAREHGKPLMSRMPWIWARQEIQRGTVAKGKSPDYYIERRRLRRQPRCVRVRYFSVINSFRTKPCPPRWTGETVDLTGGRYSDPTLVYTGKMASANPHFDEIDQGYRDAGRNEAAAHDW